MSEGARVKRRRRQEPIAPRPPSTGFTLVEVGVAVLLLALVMIPVLSLSQGGSRTVRTTSEAFVAHSAALELLEQMLVIPFAQLPVGTWGDGRLTDGAAIAPGSAWRFRLSPARGVRRHLVVSRLEQAGKLRFKKVAVEVTWQALPGPVPAGGGGPAQRQVRLAALVANDAL